MMRYILLLLLCLGLFACKSGNTTNTDVNKAATDTQVQPTDKKDNSVVTTNSDSEKYDDPAYY